MTITYFKNIIFKIFEEVPPGSNRGQNFIHNPAIFTRNEVRGQVKLKVTNIKGEKLTVIRAMRMSQKRNKWAFETLDSTLNFENEKGRANWPLDEGKKLKEKFDAIFGTTEYNKAIDKLIKMRKDQMAELKVKESDLKHLSYLKKELDDKKLDLERKEASLKSLEESCDKIENEIKELDVESDGGGVGKSELMGKNMYHCDT
uniref:Rad50/SbcC-type AAA domain-containing protein n=1 Tax=Megaselia scalaris TaxID=36166 RepID=T1GDM3_MEGSC